METEKAIDTRNEAYQALQAEDQLGERQKQVNVQRFEPIGGSRYRVKIDRHVEDFNRLVFNDREYAVVKRMSRNRMIVRDNGTVMARVNNANIQDIFKK